MNRSPLLVRRYTVGLTPIVKIRLVAQPFYNQTFSLFGEIGTLSNHHKSLDFFILMVNFTKFSFVPFFQWGGGHISRPGNPFKNLKRYNRA